MKIGTYNIGFGASLVISALMHTAIFASFPKEFLFSRNKTQPNLIEVNDVLLQDRAREKV